jgi:hypothetical protein
MGLFILENAKEHTTPRKRSLTTMNTENQNRSQEPPQTKELVGVDVSRLVRLYQEWRDAEESLCSALDEKFQYGTYFEVKRGSRRTVYMAVSIGHRNYSGKILSKSVQGRSVTYIDPFAKGTEITVITAAQAEAWLNEPNA